MTFLKTEPNPKMIMFVLGLLVDTVWLISFQVVLSCRLIEERICFESLFTTCKRF